MLRVGIIGCGKIADQHAEQIQRIADCKIVGACDKEELMAKQLYERFDAEHYYTDVGQLLDGAKPDVVHINTPPSSHFELGRQCLEAGCNIYVEKPFTLNTSEAETLIQLAKKKNLKLTVGHNYQFNHVALRMRDLVSNGYLGDHVVHMESYYGYDLGDESYAKCLLGDKKHWVRKLPGKLLHNIISHGICRIAEFLMDDAANVHVVAKGFTSPLLKGINADDIVDELRVIVSSNNTTAYFTFSSQMRPILNRFHIFGNKNSIMIDDTHQTFIKIRGTKYKSYLDHFIPPYIFAKQYRANCRYNIKKFIQRDFHMNSGMKFLIESFYHSISRDAPLPISYKEIILTSKIMDDIFTQI